MKLTQKMLMQIIKEELQKIREIELRPKPRMPEEPPIDFNDPESVKAFEKWEQEVFMPYRKDARAWRQEKKAFDQAQEKERENQRQLASRARQEKEIQLYNNIESAIRAAQDQKPDKFENAMKELGLNIDPKFTGDLIEKIRNILNDQTAYSPFSKAQQYIASMIKKQNKGNP